MNPKLQEAILRTVIDHTHYNEMYSAAQIIFNNEPPAEVIQRAIEGGVDRYRHDAIFAAKCKNLTAKLLHAIDKYDTEETE